MKHLMLFESFVGDNRPSFLTPNNRPYQVGDHTFKGIITHKSGDMFKINGVNVHKSIVESWKQFDMPPQRNPNDGTETPNIPAGFVADPIKPKRKLNPSSVIKRLVKSYIADGAESAYDINNGQCVEFADDACGILDPNNEDDNIHPLSGFDFDPEDNARWDEKALLKFNTPVPPGIDLETFDYGSHDWLYCHGKHYDAECPQGVTSVFDIPLFTRMVHLARTGKWEKDISLIKVY